MSEPIKNQYMRLFKTYHMLIVLNKEHVLKLYIHFIPHYLARMKNYPVLKTNTVAEMSGFAKKRTHILQYLKIASEFFITHLHI